MTTDVEKTSMPESLIEQVVLTVSEDKMAVRVTCPSEFAKDEHALVELERLFRRESLDWHTAKQRVADVLETAREEETGLENVVVFAGRPPVAPVDGRIEWSREYFAEGFYIDPETKRIDFNQRRANPAVEENELLVTVYPPQQGKSGRDVFGRTIGVGIAKQPPIKAGANVQWDEEVGGYRARCAGRVIYRNGIVGVEDVYHIREDISTDFGNINHNGSVIIDGAISSNVKIITQGDLEVRGSIYACEITCGGDFAAKHGINSNPEHRMYVAGNMAARHIDQATIDAAGDVVAEQEIFCSTIRTRGAVIAPGKIIGGEIMATRGITVGEAGSKAGADTMLIAGVDYELIRRISTNNREIAATEKMLEKMQAAFKAAKRKQKFLSHQQKEALTELEFKIEEGKEDVERRREENKTFKQQSLANRDARIVIKDIVYPGTVLRILDSQYAVSDTLVGPIVAKYDKATAAVALSSDEEPETE